MLLVLVVFCQPASAQEHSLKLYSNIVRANVYQPNHFDFRDQQAAFRGISLAYKRLNNGISHEFEARFNVRSRSLPNDTFSSWETQFRYERGKYWKLTDKLFVQRGLAASFFHLNEDISVISYNVFPVKINTSGVDLSYFFHLEYHITSNLYLDLNAPIISTNVGVQFSEVANPMLTERQQRQGGFDFNGTFFGMVRLGFGYMLNNKKADGEMGIEK